MNWKLIVIAFALLMGIATAGAAQSGDSGSGSGLVGTWTVQVTLRDCSTNAPLGPAFNSLVTFHRGGTMSESVATLAFAPGQRTPGHGRWSRQHGRTYLQQMINLIMFDTAPNRPGTPTYDPNLPITPGFLAGWQTVTHTITISDSGDLVSSGTNAFYKSNGDVYRTGCSSAVAHRFE
jgi:hypothetical protein